MRKKYLFVVLTLALAAVCLPAAAQSFSFDSIHASFEIPDGKYTIYTADSLTPLADLEGVSPEDLQSQWAEQGVLLQAWSKERDVCFQLTAVKDADAEKYFDIDAQTAATRAAYRKRHLSGDEFKAQGITYSSAEWKKTSQYGRFLMLKYSMKKGGEVVSRGYARKTIRNGYTITLDMQVFGRNLKGADNTALNKIISTWHFTQTLDLPASAAAKISVSEPPPTQTNSGAFTMSGTAEPGMTLTGVVMTWTSTDAVQVVSDTASKSGKFSLDFSLPSEGSYMLGVTVVKDDVETEYLTYSITYNKTLIPVNFIKGMPASLTTDKLEISGTSMKGGQIQCIVNEKNKTVRVGSNKKFSFSIDTSEQGHYSIVLVFSKKGYETQRFPFELERTFSESEIREKARDAAVKPSYNNLVKKLDGYDGRILTYNAYVTRIEKNGDQWLVFMAMTKTKTGYKDVFVVSTAQEPVNLTPETQVRVYGTCIGGYLMTEADGTDAELPMLELIFWDN